jgi:hypothetical protein
VEKLVAVMPDTLRHDRLAASLEILPATLALQPEIIWAFDWTGTVVSHSLLTEVSSPDASPQRTEGPARRDESLPLSGKRVAWSMTGPRGESQMFLLRWQTLIAS